MRLPLQVGLAGLGQATRYAALLWLGPASLLAAAMFAPLFSIVPRFFWIMFVGGGGVVALGLAFEAAEGAKRDRPSDVLLSAGGLQIEGSPDAARTLAWTEVDAGSCNIVAGEPRLAVRWLLLSWLTLRRVPWLVARERVPVYRLRLPLRAGGDVRLAEAEGDECASLEALRDSIRSASAPQEEAAPAQLPPEILRCSNCGAPQLPVDQDAAPCPFCGHAVTMPQPLREKQRALSELGAGDVASRRLVTRLISQPGARRAGRWLWLGRKLLVFSQPVAIVFLCVVVSRQTGNVTGDSGMVVTRVSPGDDALFFYDIAVLVLVLLVAFLVVWSALSAYFANRKALRVLAESFGAVPPAKPGAPARCRQCGAPLPDAAGGLLVRCAYCGSQNVLGVDPRPAVSRQRQEHRELEAALRGRRRARLRLISTLPICALLGAASVREAVLLWWVPVRDANGSCAYGHCGTIENMDIVRRSVSLTDGKVVVRATVLPRSTVFWSCSEDCSIDQGGRLTAVSGMSTQSALAIVSGTMQSAPVR